MKSEDLAIVCLVLLGGIVCVYLGTDAKAVLLTITGGIIGYLTKTA